ncbi:thioredoxin-like protein HCF164, chloroplastic [Rutidosis leptorrhynchoides]|uniref:thioredoxin-like protein HCF164, chloroplastic n=1 Tax=Rutidosis leptorrhynchoides TaxID=125765 RepID=UPI003A9A3AB0
MARLASNPVGLHKFRPSHFHPTVDSLHFIAPSIYSSNKNLRYQKLYCQIESNSTNSNPEKKLIVESPSENENNNKTNEVESSSSDGGFPEMPNKSLNRRIAVVSVVGAVGLFLSGRLDFGVSLKDLSAAALPYEEALSNGKPTVVEFYADWCEVCRELAPDVYKVEQQYRDKVNFVMLNVDNTKWEQELDEFGVEGIPHFAFLDGNGNEEGNVVGKLPKKYLLENVDALATGKQSIPHARVVGQFSSAEARKVHQVADPRSHG